MDYKKVIKAMNMQINPYLSDDELEEMRKYVQASLDKYYAKFGNPGISPTDKDAKGMYPYQEPEVDEQGTFYGYKVLNRHCQMCLDLVSPRYESFWTDGRLTADAVPNEESMHGIHFTKRPDHPELKSYFSSKHKMSGNRYDTNSVLVKCALSGTIVETEQGFRAEHAQIIGVLDDGYWKSYQDYQERASSNSRRVAELSWEEARWDYGTWQDPDTYFNPSADS